MSRRDALRAYLLQVAHDLIARGAVRHGAGQPIAHVLRDEPTRVLAEVQADLIAVLADIGGGLLAGGAVMLENSSSPFGGLAGAGLRALGALFAPKPGGSR